MKDWLETIKAGDEVIVVNNYHQSVVRVDRTTPTQLVIGSIKYNRRTGRRVGADIWNTDSLSEATPEVVTKVREQMKRRKIINRLETIRWKDVQTDILERVAELIKA